MTNLAITTTPVKLSDATLSELPEDIKRPNYDRAALKPGIVHIGLRASGVVSASLDANGRST